MGRCVGDDEYRFFFNLDILTSKMRLFETWPLKSSTDGRRKVMNTLSFKDSKI